MSEIFCIRKMIILILKKRNSSRYFQSSKFKNKKLPRFDIKSKKIEWISLTRPDIKLKRKLYNSKIRNLKLSNRGVQRKLKFLIDWNVRSSSRYKIQKKFHNSKLIIPKLRKFEQKKNFESSRTRENRTKKKKNPTSQN